MSQQNLFPSKVSEGQQIENKVMLLFLIERMDIPLSNSQIAHFAQAENLLNYYSVQKYLNEMVESGYLDKSQDNNSTRYTITDEGTVVLESFSKQLSQNTKNIIVKYVTENRKNIKQDFEVIASYFFDHPNNEYIVKCGAYEDEIVLMELNVSVASKEQAIKVCNNWKANISTLYGKVLKLMIGESEETEESEEPEEIDTELKKTK